MRYPFQIRGMKGPFAGENGRFDVTRAAKKIADHVSCEYGDSYRGCHISFMNAAPLVGCEFIVSANGYALTDGPRLRQTAETY